MADTLDLRARDLRRMRTLATGLLVLMAVIFVAASYGMRSLPWLGWVRAFAEAGMVGACADWFAVTALFRHPLGLPIPHTGIIPRNKERIGEALGSFIATNFLTADVLDAKLKQLELARWGGEWLVQPGEAVKLAQRMTALIPDALLLLPPNAIREAIGSAAIAAAGAVPAAPAASRILAAAWSDGRSQVALDWALQRLAKTLEEHDDVLKGQVTARSARWMPKFLDRLIAAKITDGIQALLAEMQAPDHPWRMELHQVIENFIAQLRDDPELAEKAEAIKRQLIQDPALHDHARSIWDDLEARFLAGDSAALATRLEKLLLDLGAWLQANDATQGRLNAWARTVVGRLVAPRRHEIGRVVAQVVAAWDSKSIVDKLELQVGPDLQYIRINGTLVGGLVGVIIYAASHALGL
ncbi:hypothetical protein sos41_35990 [Alphaproteobacteria bacterium SO-S41]|nr:hypothetical protein sos41_35990 [Alphaproteobacteria bacterium SO-S41]